MKNKSQKIKGLEEKSKDLKAQVKVLHKSTKTLFPQFAKPHNFLSTKFSWYQNWHLNPHARKIHGIGLFIFTIIIAMILLSSFLYKSEMSLSSQPAAKDDCSSEKHSVLVAKTTEGNKITQKDKCIEPKEAEFVEGEVIVKFKPEKSSSKIIKLQEVNPQDTGNKEINTLNKNLNVQKLEKVFKEEAIKKDKNLKFATVYKATIPKEKDVKQVVEEYKANPNVEYAQPNYIYKTQITPNDTYYNELWAMPKIQAPQAWDVTTGSPNITVAVVDTGVDYNHEDLQGNIWTNTDEIPGNGIDDDENGYIDDTKGWDFYSGDNDPMDDHGHGTHVSGTIAAVGNNGKGAAGVTWNSKIMPLKFLSSGGSGTTDDGALAIKYAADNGAKVINNSWGGLISSDALLESAINYAHDSRGVTVIAAAGNDNMDTIRFLPASFSNVITVGASDENDQKASFSNYGVKIDAVAPGVNVVSLRASGTDMYGDGNHFIPNGDSNAKYYKANGTSMAAPHVAGFAALLLANNPSLTNEQLRQLIRKSADDLGVVGFDSTYGSGRINTNNAFSVSSPAEAYISSPSGFNFYDGTFTFVDIYGTAAAPSFDSYALDYSTDLNGESWTNIVTSNNSVQNGFLGRFNLPDISETKLYIRLTVNDAVSGGFQYYILVYYDKTVVSGWPKTGSNITSSPVLADIDQDGKKEIIQITAGIGEDNKVNVWNEDGSAVPGWPFSISSVQVWSNGPISTPAIGDIDKDGSLEIVFGWGEYWQPYYLNGFVYALRSNGTVMYGFPGFEGEVDRLEGSCLHTPGLIDMDGDGDLEIVLQHYKGKTFALHHDGSLVSGGWPHVFSSRPPWAGIAIGDIDKDNSPDFVFGYESGSGNNLLGVDRSLNPLPGWPKARYELVTGSIIADINKDGQEEIIYAGLGGDIYVWDKDGNLLPGWPQRMGEGMPIPVTPAVGNIDNTPEPEIIVAERREGQVFAYHYNGQAVTGWPVSMDGSSVSSPIVTDIDNDGSSEILVGSSFGLVSMNGDGSLVPGWSKDYFEKGVISTPTIGDVDGDGKNELIVSSMTQVFVYNTEVNDNSPQWSGYNHDIQRTSNYSFTPVEPPIPGPLDHIDISPSSDQTTIVDQPIQFAALGQDQNHVTIFGLEYTWTGTDSSGIFPPGVFYKIITGTYQVKASSGGLDSPTINVTVNHGSLSQSNSSVLADPATVTIPGDSTITVALKDFYNNPIPSHTVTLSSTYQETGDVITQPLSPTNSSGITTGTISSALAHSSTITAYDSTDNVTLSQKPTVKFKYINPQGQVLNGWGGVHPFGGASVVSNQTHWVDWDIARDIVLRSDGTSGYVLDGWGGIHPLGGAPPVSVTGYWPGWDIARAIVLRDDNSGYILNGWGGIWPFGGAPAMSPQTHWVGNDIARDIVLRSDGQGGYVLNKYGGIHRFGNTPNISNPSPIWWGGLARAIVLRDDSSGYVLNGWGGIHAFGDAPFIPQQTHWINWDIARDFVLREDKTSGYVLNGWGGIHAFGGAPPISQQTHWVYWDIARRIGLAK